MTKDWIVVLIFSLITTFTWIGFEIYRIYHSSIVTEVLEKQMQPLQPEFDKEALDIIRTLPELPTANP